MAEPTLSAANRFEKFVDRSNLSGCHIWTGNRNASQYGQFKSNRLVKAHRFAWELANGPIPKGLNVLHRCDNPPCVNPAHLFLGTQADNIRDRDSKGRSNYQRGEHNGSAKLNEGAVMEIRSRYATGACGQRQLARDFDVCKTTIAGIVNRKIWAHL